MISANEIFYIAVVILFGVNSFNELDRGKHGRPGNYILSFLTALFWPITLTGSIIYMMLPRTR